MNNAGEILCRWLRLLKLIWFENDVKKEAKSSAGNSLMILEEHGRRLFGGWGGLGEKELESYSRAEICLFEPGTKGPAFSKREGGNISL